MKAAIKSIVADIEAQYEQGREAEGYWKAKLVEGYEEYWQGWNDRGMAIQNVLKGVIQVSDFPKYAQDTITDLNQTIEDLRLELKRERAKSLSLKREVKYQQALRLLNAGSRLVRYTSGEREWYKIKEGKKYIEISPAVVERLNKEGVQFDLWGATQKREAA